MKTLTLVAALVFVFLPTTARAQVTWPEDGPCEVSDAELFIDLQGDFTPNDYRIEVYDAFTDTSAITSGYETVYDDDHWDINDTPPGR